MEKSLTTKAAIICTEIDNLCDNIGTDTDHYKAEVSLSKTIFSKLEKEVQKYKSEVHTMTGSYREEESLLRSDAMKVLDSLLDSLKQNTMKKAKPQTHKRDSKTLLMALRNL